MASPEKYLRDHICFWIAKWGGFVFVNDSVGIYKPGSGFMRNTNPFRIQGVSDILGIWKVRPLAVEVKVGKNKMSVHQEEFAKNWAAHGGLFILAYSLLDVRIGLGLPDTVDMPARKLEP